MTNNGTISRNQLIMSLVTVIMLFMINIVSVSFMYGKLSQLVEINDKRITKLEQYVQDNNIQIARLVQIVLENTKQIDRLLNEATWR